jgi:hypothetical protein
MTFGPKTDGAYVVEFRTAAGEALAFSLPNRERDRPLHSLFPSVLPSRGFNAQIAHEPLEALLVAMMLLPAAKVSDVAGSKLGSPSF